MKFLIISYIFLFILHIKCLISNFPSSLPRPLYYLDYSEYSLIIQEKNLTDLQKQEFFLLMDHNKDGIIDKREYESFYSIFIKPFEEKCQTEEGIYTLSPDDFKKCIKNTENLEFLDGLLEDDEKVADFLYVFISTNENSLNLFHYIMMRRYAFAYKSCVKNKTNIENLQMSRSEFTCSLVYVISNKEDLSLIQANYLFSIGTRFSSSKEFNSNETISFLNFMLVCHLFNKFEFLQNNNDKNMLHENHFIEEHNSSLIHKLYSFFSSENEEFFLDFK